MSQLLESYLIYVNESNSVTAAYKDSLAKSKIECNRYKGVLKKKCMIKAQVEAKKAQLSRLKQLAGECKTAQDPNECHRTILKKAQRIMKSVRSLTTKYANISVKAKQKSKKDQDQDQDQDQDYDHFEY
jgi:hypothetical protein